MTLGMDGLDEFDDFGDGPDGFGGSGDFDGPGDFGYLDHDGSVPGLGVRGVFDDFDDGDDVDGSGSDGDDGDDFGDIDDDDDLRDAAHFDTSLDADIDPEIDEDTDINGGHDDVRAVEQYGAVDPPVSAHVSHTARNSAGANGGGGMDPLAMGTAYALYRHGQDVQTEQLVGAVKNAQPSRLVTSTTTVPAAGEDVKPPVGTVAPRIDDSLEGYVEWSEFAGQDRVKEQLQIHLNAAAKELETVPHTLIAGSPGSGKTLLARVVASAIDEDVIHLVPPFNIYTLTEALEELVIDDVAIIDDVDQLVGHGSNAEILKTILDQGVAYLPDGSSHELDDITVVATTSDMGALPEDLIARFPIRQTLTRYSEDDMVHLTINLMGAYGCLDNFEVDDIVVLADASRSDPRVAEQYVITARDLSRVLEIEITGDRVLDALGVTRDGLTEQHVQYLLALYRHGERKDEYGEIQYVAPQFTLAALLGQTVDSTARIERYLFDSGLVEIAGSDRRLGSAGIGRVQSILEQ